MKRFLGLGAALMAGVVLAKDNTYEFQSDKIVKTEAPLRTVERTVALESRREIQRERSQSREGLKERTTIGRKINKIRKVRDLTPSRDGDIFSDADNNSGHRSPRDVKT